MLIAWLAVASAAIAGLAACGSVPSPGAARHPGDVRRGSLATVTPAPPTATTTAPSAGQGENECLGSAQAD
jgi:hypothetical protein